MGYKLKNGRSIIDPVYGSANTTAYALIDFVGINKRKQEAQIDLTVYASRAARVSNYKQLDSYGVTVTGADFVTYFGPASNVTIWAQAQNYLVAKGIPNTTFIVADWMIDPLDAAGEP